MFFFLFCIYFFAHRDLNQVYDGIGHKIGMFIHAITVVIVGFVMGFVYGWKLTLVIIAVSPLLAIAGGLIGKVNYWTTNELRLSNIYDYRQQCNLLAKLIERTQSVDEYF